MKVKNALPTLITDGSIFTHLTDVLNRISLTPYQMGLRYYTRSGEKSVNSLVDNFSNDDGEVTTSGISTIGQLVHDYYIDQWTRIIDALTAEYNPIENYDRNEDTSNVNSGSDTDVYGQQSNTYGGRNVTDTHSVTPYNSSTLITDDKNEHTENARNDQLGSHTDTHQKGSTLRTTSHVHGNVGVTTNQQMITAEIELRKNNIADIICNDIDNMLCLKVYE